MLRRINLFNYHQQEIKYLKIRTYLIFGMALLLAVIINLVMYLSIELSISEQQETNTFWTTQLHSLNKQVEPVSDFKKRISTVSNKIKLIKYIDEKRSHSIALLHIIYYDTPEKLYYTSINTSFDTNTIYMKGVAGGPLFIANLLDKMRESDSPFKNVQLKNNTTNDQNTYNFEIGATINKELLEAEFESYGR